MRGQVILILLLVMAVALGIGLSIIQRSFTDVSTASKIEESSRAFSAAEAGIEKSLQGTCTSDPCVDFGSTNSSSATTHGGGLLPSSGQALEYPPISKEGIAQFWLSDPTSPGTTTPSPATNKYFNPNTTPYSLDLYWGDPTLTADKAAIEITFIYYDSATSTYKNEKKLYDQISRNNGFDIASNCIGNYTTGITGGATFQCKQSLSSLKPNLKIMRARLLYNSSPQPVGLKPITTNCTDGCSIPPQAKVILSTGSAGSTQRTVKLFSIDKVVPQFFDYAIFSVGDINK